MTQPHLEYFSPPATGFDPLRQLSLTSLCTLEVGESVPVLLLFLSTCMETKKRFYTATDLSDDTREFLSLEVILWSTFLFFFKHSWTHSYTEALCKHSSGVQNTGFCISVNPCVVPSPLL